MNMKISNLFYSIEKFARRHFEVPSSRDYARHVLLASFPKSGNTWLRFVVSNVNALASGEGGVNFSTINHFSPAIRGNRGLISARQVEGYPLFLKTHFPYVDGFSGYPSVVIVRNPFKVIPSYCNYLQLQHSKRFADPDEFYFHWRYGFNAWSNFMTSWQDKATVVLRYEDVQADPLNTLREMYRAIGYEIGDGLLSEAINLSSRDKMKKSLSEFGDPNNSNGFEFVRKESDNVGIDAATKDRILQDPRLAEHFFVQALRYGYL